MTSAPLRVGFGLPVAGAWATPESIVSLARHAEDLGYASLWAFQRTLWPADGRLPSTHRHVLDPVVALTLAAGHTQRIGLGTATVCAPFTPPALLASTMASLDVISKGRLSVGLGMGWLPEEHVAAGVPMTQRGARFEEYLQCLIALWTQRPVEFSGEFYTVPPSFLSPEPVQRPHPDLLLGGTADAALRRAGRLAQGWIASSQHDHADLARSIGVVRQAAAAAGRDPGTLRIVVRTVPDPNEIDVDLLAPLADLGVTDVILDLNLSPHVGSPGVPPEHALAIARRALTALAPRGPMPFSTSQDGARRAIVDLGDA